MNLRQHIIVDEVHERSIDCKLHVDYSSSFVLSFSRLADFLLIVLKSLMQERKDLKYVFLVDEKQLLRF